MKKKLLIGLATGIFMACMAGSASATPTTLISQGSFWDYTAIGSDLWGAGGGDWASADYSSFDWSNASWLNGQAAFGRDNPQHWSNPIILPSIKTDWAPNTDLALQQNFNFSGDVNSIINLNVAVDNGFMVFVNDQQIAKENMEGTTNYWQYGYSMSLASMLNIGQNTIRVLAEDHGDATFFDLELTADIAPVPEPTTMLLFGTGLMGIASSLIRRKKRV